MGAEIWLSIQVYGFAILISLLVAVMIRGVVVTLSSVQRKPAPATTPAPAAAVAASDEGHIAAIAAAVYAVLGAVRIVHIEDAGRGAVWTAEGRIAHHASHDVRHQPKK